MFVSKNFDPQRASASNQRKIAEALQKQVRGRPTAPSERFGTWRDPGPAPKPAKYRNQRTAYTSPLVGPKIYDSKKEADFAATLDGWRAAGIISYWLPQQPRWPLPGGVVYVSDFMTVADGKCEYFDVKGRDTQVSINKRKQVRAIFGVEIRIV